MKSQIKKFETEKNSAKISIFWEKTHTTKDNF